MSVVYFSITPTFEPSRYYKCWIVCFYDKTAISNYCSSCLAGTCSGEYCAGVPGWVICWILLSDSRNLCCDRSFEYWVWNQYGLDNEISDYYDSSVCSTPTYRYGDSCSN